MKVNKRLLPIKLHYFFFMAAMGPILPQLAVFGKELGVSSIVMGSVTGLLPIAYLLAKPAFGMIVDIYRNYRKCIFICIIVIMVMCFALMNLVPPQPKLEIYFNGTKDSFIENCSMNEVLKEKQCNNETTRLVCESNSFNHSETFFMDSVNSANQTYRLCYFGNSSINYSSCDMKCTKDIEHDNGCLYKSLTFWLFIVLMSLGSIGFNVVNSISDAICFDVIGTEYDYGKQRVWGSIGFGISALIAGYAVNYFSGSAISYTPAFIVMLICSIIDLIACSRVQLPIIEYPENLIKQMVQLMNNRHVIVFMIYAVFAGVLDSFIIYYLFWYLEDLAEATQTKNVKLLEGLIVAAETLGGEVIFFSIAGKILDRIGHVHCFSMCFVNYALRLGLISVAPSPWWIVPVEFVLQGPTYALTYTTVVEYANELAPPGASATMQGIAAGMDDGFGYAVGSFLGGLLYKFLGGKNAMHIFSVFGVFCSISHLILHKTYLSKRDIPQGNGAAEYNTPDDAIKATYDSVT